MKKPFFALFILAGLIVFASFTDDLRSFDNRAFKRGEYLKYRVFYDSWVTSGLTAGIGTVRVLDENKKFHGRDTYHLEVIGRSVGLFNWFFKVRDKFESYVDTKTLAPWLFIRHTREGSFRKEDKVIFNQFENTAKSTTMERNVPPYVQDIVSAFFYMRNLPMTDLEQGDTLSVQFHLDDSVYNSKILFRGRQDIETKLGRFRSLVFQPKVARGEVFDTDYPMTLWVSDDRNHIPLLVESEVIIGAVKIELIDYNNLANPLTARID